MKKLKFILLALIIGLCFSCNNFLKPGGVKFELINQSDFQVADFKLYAQAINQTNRHLVYQLSSFDMGEEISFSVEQEILSELNTGEFYLNYSKNGKTFDKNFGKIEGGQDMSANGIYTINILPTYIYIGED